MMRKVFLVVVCAGWLIGCSTLKEEVLPTYDMKSFLLESQPGCESDTVACAKFLVEYPHFTNLDTLANASIKKNIEFWLAGGAEGEPKPMEVMGSDFMRDYGQFQRDMPDYGLGWNFTARVQVLVASDSLISLQVDVESFTGGAHGSYTTNYINVDPKTGTPYLLDSFLKPGYEEVLNELGERDFRRQRDLEGSVSLEEAGFNFPANQFRLNDNYGFRKEGIVFFFNSYEIAAYVEGPTEILIPYEELREWYK
jgi:hypothetical protein